MIDQQETLHTASGTSLTLSLAGPIPRAAAWLVDFLIRALFYLAMAVLLSSLGQGGTGLLLIIIFLLEWGYPVLFEALWHGQTPGKKWLGIAVIQSHGGPVSWNSAFARNLLRVADFFPAGYATGLLCMLMNKRFQRLGDLAADTLVVHVHEDRNPAHFSINQLRAENPDNDYQVKPDFNGQADWPLKLETRQALASLLERHNQLTPARRAELAQIIFPEMDAQEAWQRIKAIASGVAGQG